jgi:hypothetical protein
MSNQVIKIKIPDEYLFNFLIKVCTKKNAHCYIFNNDSYKKALYFNLIEELFVKCRPHYHKSKYHYFDKPITYNSVSTILRQLTKHIGGSHSSKIEYVKSQYGIVHCYEYKHELIANFIENSTE